MTDQRRVRLHKRQARHQFVEETIIVKESGTGMHEIQRKKGGARP